MESIGSSSGNIPPVTSYSFPRKHWRTTSPTCETTVHPPITHSSYSTKGYYISRSTLLKSPINSTPWLSTSVPPWDYLPMIYPTGPSEYQGKWSSCELELKLTSFASSDAWVQKILSSTSISSLIQSWRTSWKIWFGAGNKTWNQTQITSSSTQYIYYHLSGSAILSFIYLWCWYPWDPFMRGP